MTKALLNLILLGGVFFPLSQLLAQSSLADRGTFLYHIIEVNLSGGGLRTFYITNYNPTATVNFSGYSETEFDGRHFVGAELALNVPAETPLIHADNSYETPMPVSAKFTATWDYCCGHATQGSIASPGTNIVYAYEQVPSIGSPGVQTTTITLGTELPGLYNQLGQISVSPRMSFQTSSGFAAAVRIVVESRYTRIASDGVIVLDHKPVQGTVLTNKSKVNFNAFVEYRLNGYEQGELILELRDSQKKTVAASDPAPITRGLDSQYKSLQLPSLEIRREWTNLTMVVVLSSGENLQVESFINPPYGIASDDSCEILNLSPSPGTPIPNGTNVTISADVRYLLKSRDKAELLLELLKPGGMLIVALGPYIVNSSSNPQTRSFTLPAQAISALDRSYVLRAVLMNGQEILAEARKPLDFKDPENLGNTFRILSLTGEAEAILPGAVAGIPITVGMTLPLRTRIVTGFESEVGVTARTDGDGSVWTIKELTDTSLDVFLSDEEATRTRLWLKAGEVSAEVNPNHAGSSDFTIRTPTAVCGVRGTKFTITHTELPEPKTKLVVTEGTVEVTPANSSLAALLVTAGNSVEVTATRIISPNGPTITGISPATGVSGVTEVTVSGANFSATASNNVVTFGGIAGTVTGAASGQLTVRVPAGLPDGTEPLAVSVNGFTSAATNFIVSAEHAATVVSGAVTGLWTRANSPYYIYPEANVPAGGELQIEPGVVVMVAAIYGGLFVGGKLIAEGTATAPIRFTSAFTNKTTGQWSAIRFEGGETSSLRYCVFEYGGGLRGGIVEVVNTSPRFHGCTFLGSSGQGIFLSRANPLFNACYFTKNTDSPIWINDNSFPLLVGNFATGNGRDVISVYPATITRDGLWMNDRIPYLLRDSITIGPTNKLTIAAGATVQGFGNFTTLFIQGTLEARGEPGNPIIFTSDEAETNKTRGQWGGITFLESTDDTNSIMDNCVIEYAGGFRAAAVEFIQAAPAIRNCTIGGSISRGFDLQNSSPEITGCVIHDCADAAVRMTPTSFPFLRGNSSLTNAINAIQISPGTVATNGTWTRDTIPYKIYGQVYIPTNVLLNIEVGTVVQFFDEFSSLYISGGLAARGSATMPVRFTTDEAHPAPGQWGGITFDNANSYSALEHCVIEYGGAFRNSQVELLNSSPLIEDCVFQYGIGDGLFVRNSATQVQRSSFLQNGRDGIRTDNVGSFSAANSVIISNAGFGIRNFTTQVMIARNNYWGDASGPRDTTNGDGLNLLNATDTGEEVSDYVEWSSPLVADPTGPVIDPPLNLLLNIAQVSGTALILSWEASLGAVTLQQISSFGGTNTWNAANFNATTNAGRVNVIVNPDAATRFYRLNR